MLTKLKVQGYKQASLAVQKMNYAEAIANEYSVKRTSKVVALKKLDRKAKEPANIFAFTFGVVASLVLGVGMCLSMKVIGKGMAMFILGIILGVIGITGVSANYFIYKRILEKGKQKYVDDIFLQRFDIGYTGIFDSIFRVCKRK